MTLDATYVCERRIPRLSAELDIAKSAQIGIFSTYGYIDGLSQRRDDTYRWSPQGYCIGKRMALIVGGHHIPMRVEARR